ncbi:exocyst complex component 7 isoform X4 [Lethenteron reissneri]|uniref:exocyst complex component 7 isoform X4 n=1 Tax=Lethenteron reissneri TaxID=7753 RepID=UPI002AB6F718|nr:exocyst complex component 7 isoform X4 [Lethenteron reissneri]
MPAEETVSARKRDIEEKLNQEQHVLNFIRESLDKSEQQTASMVGILSSFECRLARLEDAIVPVYRQTETLQRLQENVERTLGALHHVIGYYSVARDTQRVVKEGPAGRLEEYLECMARIQNAVEYFTENNPDSPELNTVKSLFENGKEWLEGEARTLLQRHSKAVPPVLLLDALAQDEDEAAQEGEACATEGTADVHIQQLPERALADLVRISHWLVESGRSHDLMTVYYQLRSGQMLRSLQGLKEHLRRSHHAAAGHSPAVGARRTNTPTKRLPASTGKRTGTLRKAQNLLKQYAQQEARKGCSNLSPMEGSVEAWDVEIDAYILCVSAFVKLAHSEYQLLTQIIPDFHHKKTFDSLIQESLDSLVAEGDGVVAAARRAVMRHDYSAVLSVLPVLRHLKACKPQFDIVLQGTAAPTKNKLPTLISAMETTGAKALEEFADSIKNDPDKEYNMPKDGTVHELTSNAILFLQQLLDFQETAAAMLASQVLGDTYNIPWSPVVSSEGTLSHSSEFSRKLLSTYVSRVLGNLQGNLLSKCRVYEDPALGCIFLLNNYNYTLKALQRSELLQLVEVTQPNLERTYEELIDSQLQSYRRSWMKVLESISDRNMPVLTPGAKLKDKERQVIKDRFKGFNEGLEELCRVQKCWAVPERELRERLRQEGKKLLLNSYRVFVDRYGSVPFTKNPSKYVRFRSEQVAEMIDRLFDTSA